MLRSSALGFSLVLCLCGLACSDSGEPSDDACRLPEGESARDTCVSFCEVGIACNAFTTGQELCELLCECNVRFGEEISAECGQAWEAENVCFAGLTCDDIALLTNELPEGAPCRDEFLATNELCFEQQQ